MGLEAILGLLGSSGLMPSPNMPLDPSGPTLNELTLNPDVLPGGNPPQVPYAPGMGPNLLRTQPQPPMAPVEGGPTEGTQAPGSAEGTSTADKIKQIADLLGKFGGLQKSMEKNPVAAQMFQEQQQRQIMGQQMNAKKMQEFKRRDLSSQILAKYGLL